MPDWITHIAVAYIICTLLSFRYPAFNTPNTVLALVGAVIPDFVKMGLIADLLGFGVWDYLWPIHLPVGSFIIAGIISLLFKDKKTAFLFLSLGVVIHFALDLLLYNVSGGIALFFPLYWGAWQMDLFTTENLYVTLMALITAFLVFIIKNRRIDFSFGN
jgi:hypothetical protein